MKSEANDCDATRIDRFLRRELTDQEHAELSRHLDHCATCSLRLEAETCGSAWWQAASSFLIDVPDDFHTLAAAEDGSESPTEELVIQHVLKQLAPTDDPRMLGRLGNYEVAGVIGTGGMGIVLKAFDPALASGVLR